MATYISGGKPIPRDTSSDLPLTVEKYLQNGASEGERNNTLFAVAAQCRDIDMPQSEAVNLLLDKAMAGGLSESESISAIGSAYQGAKREAPKGARGGNPATGDFQRSIDRAKRTVGRDSRGGDYGSQDAHDADASRHSTSKENAAIRNAQPVQLPDPFEEGFEAILLTAFEEGEGVCVGGTFENDDGEFKPDKGVTLSREKWLERIRDCKGVFSKMHSSKDGHFLRVNPMRIDPKSKNTNEDVTSFRHCLVEFDSDRNGKDIPKDRQLGAFLASGLPISAILDSGNKSLHAWVRLDAEDKAQYEERAAEVYALFQCDEFDSQNHNPNRYSRCPDGLRLLTDGPRKGELSVQRLLKVNAGADNWEEWESQQVPPLLRMHPVVSASELEEAFPDPPTPVIEGILGVGEKMILGGSSKAGKTYSLLNLASAVSVGGTWLGYPCRKGKVLFLNFEVSKARMAERVRHLEEAQVAMSGVDFLNLRGVNLGLPDLIGALEYQARLKNYRVIVLDPIYKLLGEANENDNTAVAMMLADVERIAVETGAAVAYAHHFRKGNLSDVTPMDRMSGAGSFARDPDAILTLTDHEEKGCASVAATVRNYASPEERVVQYQFPKFIERSDLDPSKVKGKQQGGHNKKGGKEQVVGCLSLQGGIMPKKDLVELLANRQNSTPKSARNWISDSIKHNLVLEEDGLCMLSSEKALAKKS